MAVIPNQTAAAEAPQPNVTVAPANVRYVPQLVDEEKSEKSKPFTETMVGQVAIGVAAGLILANLSK